MTILSSALRWFLLITFFYNAPVGALDLSVDMGKLGVKKPIQKRGAHTLFNRYEQTKIAQEFVRQLRATGKVVTDPTINAYVQTLGKKLARQSSSGKSIQFLVINDPNVNAFAGLGGVIAIHTGMILRARNEGELASVLAHEIAHVSQHHIERAIEASKSGGALIQQALLLALAVVAGDKNPQVTQAAITVASGLQIQQSINHTRSHEIEADAVGVQILSRAGYSAKSMEDMFESLSKSQRFTSSQIPSFLLTHPLTTDRRAKMHGLAKSLPKRGKDYSKNFIAIQQAVKLLANKRLHKADLRTGSGKAVRALQLLRLGKTGQAQSLAAKAESQAGGSFYTKLLLGQYFSKAGQQAKAVAWYRKAYQQSPRNMGAMLRLSEALIRQGSLKQAKKILDQAVKQDAPEARQAMAKYFARKGDLVQSYYWQAEYSFMSGYTKQAIGHLGRAKKALGRSKSGFYLGSKIDARLKAYKRVDSLS